MVAAVGSSDTTSHEAVTPCYLLKKRPVDEEQNTANEKTRQDEARKNRASQIPDSRQLNYSTVGKKPDSRRSISLPYLQRLEAVEVSRATDKICVVQILVKQYQMC